MAVTSFPKAAVLSLLVSAAALSPTSAQTAAFTSAYPWRQDVYVIAPPAMSPIAEQRVSYPAFAPVRHPERPRVVRRYRG